MSLHEIVLPETEPETEWVNGRALQKVSPIYAHGRLQGEMYTALSQWAERGHGRVATEWRFRVNPPGEVIRPLIPDVAYLSYASFPADLTEDDVASPIGVPTVAVEVLSKNDRRRDIDDKIGTYLRAGTTLVLIVDGKRRIIEAHDSSRSSILSEGDTIEHAALPGFSLRLSHLFP